MVEANSQNRIEKRETGHPRSPFFIAYLTKISLTGLIKEQVGKNLSLFHITVMWRTYWVLSGMKTEGPRAKRS